MQHYSSSGENNNKQKWLFDSLILQKYKSDLNIIENSAKMLK